MKEELTPCPFCGRKPEIVQTIAFGKDVYAIACINKECACEPRTLRFADIETAKEIWNERK